MFRTLSLGSVAGALALAPAGSARADGPAPPQAPAEHPHHPHVRLVWTALHLDSLSPAQRTQIQALDAQEHAAREPVRQTESRLLTALAAQVEQGHIDRAALQATLDAEEAAARAETGAVIEAYSSLHPILTPEQRGQVVDKVAAELGVSPAPPALDAFRGDSFQAQALVHAHDPGERTVSRVEAQLPSLSSDQRTALATHLRARAAKEGAS